MKDRHIANDEGRKQPVAQMNAVIMVKIVPNILKFQLAIIIVCVMSLRHILVQSGIEIAQNPSAVGWSVVEKQQDSAEIDQSKHVHDPPESLHRVEEI